MTIDNALLVQKLSGKSTDDAPCNCGSLSLCFWCTAESLIRSEFGDGWFAGFMQKLREWKAR